jgi:alkylated DNA repair dioxygenase AlkB
LRGSVELPLFSALVRQDPAGVVLVDEDGDVRLFRGWLARERADALLAWIRANAIWKAERRKMYDRFVDVPREQTWFGDDRAAWPPELQSVRRSVEAFTGARFGFVLLNRYRDRNDSVAWHGDREGEDGRRPVIASLTLGATRAFDVRPKRDRGRITSTDLEHGDLIVMRGATQEHWEHRIAKERRPVGERINLTFRQLPE